ncbi:DUF4388 domain-containing protein [Thermopolyspora sp. NPDC052614]|uniref:DUF4388 domain-containing protein n=1 Tax=Thermopolyspora sp. NPDC052614 TaxID=3155682 RepID=UPI0034214878
MASSGQRLPILLAGLAEDRATGALRVGGAGTIYLTDGCVTYVESAVAPRIEEILTASSRVPASAVRRARRSAAGTADGGEALVRQGVLTRGELQFCVFRAIADAAYFVLAATGTRQRFRAGDRHWLGVHWHADVTGLIRECERRRTQLDNIWPSDELDAEPVVPVARPPGQRVVLTALQWELLVHADRSATPAELARRLGRPVYATLAAVRHLAAAGLLRRPEPAVPAPAAASARAGTAPGAHTDAPRAEDTTAQATTATALPAEAGAARAVPEDTAGDLLAANAVGLPRRIPGAAALPGPSAVPRPTADPPPRLAPAVNGDPTDVSLLMRLRKALEELL